MTTYIKRYLFEDAKLRDRALLELTRGLRDGRLIALTGAMTTEALGYFSWRGLCNQFAAVANERADEIEKRLGDWARTDAQARSLLQVIRLHCQELASLADENRRIDNRVHFNIVREAFDAMDNVLLIHGRRVDQKGKPYDTPRKTFDDAFAAKFQQRSDEGKSSPTQWSKEDKPSPIKPLLEELGITRFVTLNYDFELERELMLRSDERNSLGHKRNIDAADEFLFIESLSDDAANGFLSFERLAVDPADGFLPFAGIAFDATDRLPSFEGSTAGPAGGFLSFVGSAKAQRPILIDSLHRMSRINGDGLTVESDILNRERVDRLIEFAAGSANVDRHILHLHGRADRPEKLILDIRDYDQLYRRDDLFKNQFEHGLRVLFAGNPVLFVGVGMSEAEINATLQDFVSDNPYRRTAPTFLLWNTTGFSTNPAARAEEKRLRRLDYLQRLGVLVLFDDDLVC